MEPSFELSNFSLLSNCCKIQTKLLNLFEECWEFTNVMLLKEVFICILCFMVHSQFGFESDSSKSRFSKLESNIKKLLKVHFLIIQVHFLFRQTFNAAAYFSIQIHRGHVFLISVQLQLYKALSLPIISCFLFASVKS